MNSQVFKKYNLPDKPGIYKFMKGEEILYIGKATSLKDRTKSYFSKDLINTRGPLILDMVFKAQNIEWIETPSVLEALILEANLIKKYQPYYNTKEKDDKSFNYVYITKDFKLGTIRGRELNIINQNPQKIKILRSSGRYAQPDTQNFNFLRVFGPFTSGGQLKEALKIIRKFFPYIDDRRGAKGKEEFYKQLKLSPENSIENKNNIKNIILFFEGKKKKIISFFKKEMLALAKKQKFEEAGEIKRKIFALEHINDIALIKEEFEFEKGKTFSEVLGLPSSQPDTHKKSYLSMNFRIEAYDVAHMSGKNMVGVMVVLEDNEFSKKEYKKFKIKTQTDANDTGALEEILERRFNHPEWILPNLIVVDGSTAQINIAKKVLKEKNLKIDIASVVKDERHKAREIKYIGKGDLEKYKKQILKINEEAHRFAINYHKQMRSKNFLR
jgi:excinuclease ABC subunit C